MTRPASAIRTAAEQAGGAFPDRIQVIDSHTEGEPTRVVVAGWPQPRGTTMAERRDDVQRSHDALRRAVVCEPRGHDAVVGALLTPPVEPASVAGVIFFNNVGYLGMCGHGLIGVVRTLEHLGRLGAGDARIDTPVGTVGVRLDADGAVTVRNVPARVHALDVSVEVPGYGRVTGDVAWGGNWFFISELDGPALTMENRDALLDVTRSIQAALNENGITAADGAPIDHVELSSAAHCPDADARNFVLCPGGVYDRSPCGTGTSAKLAVLHARGQLAPDTPWRQECITGGRFTAWLGTHDGELVPHIRGTAWIIAETTLRFDPHDPFRAGIPGT